MGEDARLARAGAGDDQQRPFGVEDGLPLGGIQVGEILLGREDGHSAMLARADDCVRAPHPSIR